MKKLYKLFIIICFFLAPKSIYAESVDYQLDLSCPGEAIIGTTFTCTASVNYITSDVTVTNISGNISISDNLESLSQSTFNIIDENGISSGKSINFNVKVKSSIEAGSATNITLKNINANNLYSSNDVTTTVVAVSDVNTLRSLSLTGASISFNPTTYSYTVNINDSKTTISADAVSSTATVTGKGEKTLEYGRNEFNIVVSSSQGDPKTYKIIVNREDNRSNDATLSELSASNMNINFSSTKTEYNVTTTASETIISATASDSKSTVTGTGKKSLNYGANKVSIVVTAENGDKKTYVLNITREDNRSTNNYLKSITLSSGTINFSKTTMSYNITVANTVDKIKVTATLDDSKAKIIEGSSSRDVSLSSGNNTIVFKVQSEKGDVRTYTLNINRDDGRNSDSTLKELKIENVKFDFEPTTLEYNINVEYDVEKVSIKATANSDKAKVTIDKNLDLKVGENVINVVVEAENGAKSTYVLNITRKKEGYELSDNNYIKKLTIKNYDLDFDSKTKKYTINTKEDTLDIDVVLEDKKATYEIIGNENLENGSIITIKVTAENGSVTKYTLEIKKSSNIIIIAIIVLVTLIAGGLIYIVILNMKKRKNASKKEKIETIDDDFVEA